MNRDHISSITSSIMLFYAKCLVYPYDEMNYELQHLFRIIEREEVGDDQIEYIEQVLSVINVYQGEEIRDLREEYVSLFTFNETGQPLCPMMASDFNRFKMIKYDPWEAEELILDSGIPINMDEPVDSVINYLEYFSLLCEEALSGSLDTDKIHIFFEHHIINWIPIFCDTLYKRASLNFFKEVAFGLKNYLIAFD